MDRSRELDPICISQRLITLYHNMSRRLGVNRSRRAGCGMLSVRWKVNFLPVACRSSRSPSRTPSRWRWEGRWKVSSSNRSRAFRKNLGVVRSVDILITPLSSKQPNKIWRSRISYNLLFKERKRNLRNYLQVAQIQDKFYEHNKPQHNILPAALHWKKNLKYSLHPHKKIVLTQN